MDAILWTVLSALALLGLWTAVLHLRRLRWGLALRRPKAGLSVLLLVQDQADGLELLLGDLLEPDARGWDVAVPYEVVAVDAGSRDESLAILWRLARHHPSLRVLPPADPAAGEDPLLRGWRLCRHPVVVCCDLRRAGAAAAARPVLAAVLGGMRPLLPGRAPLQTVRPRPAASG